MNSKIIDICVTKDQADYSEAYCKKAGYKNVKKEQIVDCTLAEVTGPDSNNKFTTTPQNYYDDRNGQLWIVTADAPN